MFNVKKDDLQLEIPLVSKRPEAPLKDKLKKLVELSKIDAELLELEQLLLNLPQDILAFEAEQKKIVHEFENYKTTLAKLESEKRSKESDLAEKKDWIVKGEEKLKAIKTNKEYHALLKEISLAKKTISLLEEQITKLTDAIQNEQNRIGESQNKVESEESTTSTQVQEMQEQLRSIEEKRKAKCLEREQFLEGIDASIISHYNLIRQKISPALALAENGFCCECNTKIPPQIFNDLHRLNSLISCPRCRRILYLELALD